MSVIAFKEKNLLIPEPFMQRALKDSKAVGYAIKDTGSLAVDWNPETNESVLKDLMETQTTFQDEAMVFAFLDKSVPGEEQPYYICANEKKDGILVGFADGTFRNFIPTKGDEGHSNIWWMFTKYLKPKLIKIHANVGLAKLHNELADPITNEELESLGQEGGGTLVLFDANGDHSLFTNSDKFRKFSWGYASNHLDIAESTGHEEKAEAPPAEETRMERLKRLKAAKAKTEAAAPIIAGATSSEATGETVQTAEATYPADAGTEYIDMYPPEDVKSNNKLKHWYQSTSKKYNGYAHLPKEFKDRCALRVKKPSGLPASARPAVVKSFAEIPKETIKDMGKKVIAAVTPIKQPDKKDQGRGVVENTALPILAPKVIESIQEDFKTSKVLDKNSMEMPVNPLKLQEEEDKYPSFWEQTLIERDHTDRWSDATLLNLCEKYPKAAFSLLKNYRADSIINRPKEEQDEDTVDVSGSGTVAETRAERIARLKKDKRVAM